MSLLVHNPGFSQVFGNYGGSVSITIGGDVATVTPGDTRASAASIWMELVSLATITHETPFTGFVNDSGVLVMKAGVSFTLAASGNTQTRLGVDASASGTEVTGTGVHLGGLYPAGLKFKGFYLNKSTIKASAAGDGSNPLIWGTASGSVDILDTYENVWNFHETVYPSGDIFVADLWMGGRSFGRYQVTKARMVHPGRKPDPATLRLSLSGVSQ